MNMEDGQALWGVGGGGVWGHNARLLSEELHIGLGHNCKVLPTDATADNGALSGQTRPWQSSVVYVCVHLSLVFFSLFF